VGLNSPDLTTLRLPPWPHFLVQSQAAFAAVTEFADDPEWTGLGSVPWPPEMTGLVVFYRAGGRRGFQMPPEEARVVLQRYGDFTIAEGAA
jgi:hypothetical protein